MQWNGLKLVGLTILASKVALFLLCGLGWVVPKLSAPQ